MQTSIKRTNLASLVMLHLYPGVIIFGAYILLAPTLVDHGFPGLAALLIAELLVLAPLEIGHILNWDLSNVRSRLQHTLSFLSQPPWWKVCLWSIGGLVVCAVVYAPLFSVGLWVRRELLSWAPVWFFDPGFTTSARSALIITFGAGLVIDGIIGPIVEEIYFRGYLLPKMQWMGNMAPLVHALLFTLYHFWQPHNYPAIFMVSLVLSYVAWWRKSIWISAGIHCLMNLTGSMTGLLAAMAGVVPY